MQFKLGLVISAIWIFLLSGAGQAQTSGVAEGKSILGQTSGGVAEGKSIPGDVTFEVPVNLTRLAGDITTVAVSCMISSDAIMLTRTIKGTTYKENLGARLELPVAAGQLVTTARVVVPVPTNAFTDPTYAVTSGPAGQMANYQCGLMGFSALPTTNGGGWSRFTADNPNESFRLSPTPLPITGSFIW